MTKRGTARSPSTGYPVRHRRKVPFAPRLALPSGGADRLDRISQLDHELSGFVVAPAEFASRIEEVVASNLHASVHLEGNPLDERAVRAVTRASLRGAAHLPQTPPRREVLNEVAAWLLPEELALPWSVETLTGLHRQLLTGVDPGAKPGRLRTTRSAIYSDQDEILFLTCPPEHVREELTSLLRWLNTEAPTLSPLAAGAVFFHEFESIHPFVEGNGRTGRILFHAYLQNRGLPNAYRARVEVELLRDSEAYYAVLSRTDATGQYDGLLAYFSEAVVRAYEEAVAWFRSHDVGPTVSSLAHLLLRGAFAHRGWWNLRLARSWAPTRSDQTVRAHLNRLVEMGLLEAEGKTRARRYRFLDPFSELRGSAARLRTELGSKSGSGKERGSSRS